MRRETVLSSGWYFRKGAGEPLPFHLEDPGWRSVTLPHDWGIEGPFDGWIEPKFTSSTDTGAVFMPGNDTGALPWTGCGYYVHDFYLPEVEKGQSFRLEFDGVMSHSTVMVNDKIAGGRVYGYSSFACDITPLVNFGKKRNRIVVKAENPVYLSRWYPGAGIYREVRLVCLPQKHFCYNGIHLETTELDCIKKTATLKITAEGFSAEELHTEIRFGGKVVSIGEAELHLAGIELWSPENPALYEVTVRGGEDEVTLKYGFRKLIFDSNNGMKLNGAPYRFRGLCMHHDLGVFGTAFHKEVMTWRLRKVKALGCNALRMAHNPPDPKLLDLCDEMGFLVMDEAFDMWRTKKTSGDYHNEFDACHERDLRDLIRRDRNHPCVVLWSIGNEIPDEVLEQGAEIAEELVRICHEEDMSRPVTAAISHQKEEDKPELHAFAEKLDVIGFNYKPELYPILHKRHPNKAIYGSETSAVVSSRGEYFFPEPGIDIKRPEGYNSAYGTEYAVWSNDSEIMFQALEECSWVLGEFAWCTFDYLGEPFPHPFPNRSSCFALFDLAGLPKDRAYLYAAQWHRKETPEVLHILPHWNWLEGQKVPVHVFTSCASAELFLNGRSLGVRYTKPGAPRLVWDNISFEVGKLEAIGYDENLREIARSCRVTAGEPAAIGCRIEREPSTSGGTYVFAELYLTDAQGNEVETAGDELEIEITGGTLIGIDNGDARCLLPFKRRTVKLYNGRAMAIAQMKEGGTITVRCARFTLPCKIKF